MCIYPDLFSFASWFQKCNLFACRLKMHNSWFFVIKLPHYMANTHKAVAAFPRVMSQSKNCRSRLAGRSPVRRRRLQLTTSVTQIITERGSRPATTARTGRVWARATPNTASTRHDNARAASPADIYFVRASRKLVQENSVACTNCLLTNRRQLHTWKFPDA